MTLDQIEKLSEYSMCDNYQKIMVAATANAIIDIDKCDKPRRKGFYYKVSESGDINTYFVGIDENGNKLIEELE